MHLTAACPYRIFTDFPDEKAPGFRLLPYCLRGFLPIRMGIISHYKSKIH